MNIALCNNDQQDNVLIKQLVSKILSEKQIAADISCFESSTALLDYITGNNVDIVLLDLLLDENNGIGTVRKIRELKGNSVKIAFISSVNSYATETYEVGAAGFILKPVTETSVEKLLLKLLGEKERR